MSTEPFKKILRTHFDSKRKETELENEIHGINHIDLARIINLVEEKGSEAKLNKINFINNDYYVTVRDGDKLQQTTIISTNPEIPIWADIKEEES